MDLPQAVRHPIRIKNSENKEGAKSLNCTATTARAANKNHCVCTILERFSAAVGGREKEGVSKGVAVPILTPLAIYTLFCTREPVVPTLPTLWKSALTL